MIIHGKVFEPYITQEELAAAAKRMGHSISKLYANKPLLILPVLNGSFIFAADLVRHITIPCHVSFVKTSSYHGMHSSGSIKQLIGLNEDISQYHVLIVEDIIDTGETIYHLLNDLAKRNPLSVEVACCLFKKEALQQSVEPNYVGFEIENVFVVGYGLDYDGLGRNLAEVYKIKPN
jgi:hypoxanthine phosphoribosyltransferase